MQPPCGHSSFFSSVKQLLGISNHFEERKEKEEDRGGVGNCCECEGGVL
ncbi:hypothetical protein Patl1_32009 [Pistacia atlantica]|uniref:Uncharacterized protein n=1 Tax=Pistacia atlantica TaxID=434234 RepID=A0ACC1ARU0_9ROSI|nr:hypothetical protein Patl1_32009 [Pistacia atlantica]